MFSWYGLFLSFLSMVVEKMSFYKVAFDANRKYQFALVPAGTTVQVYTYGNWGVDFRAFINKIGFGPKCLPWELLNFLFIIDGEVVERFNYQIAEIKKPERYDDHPYIARSSINWRVENNSAVDHFCEVLCDGMLVMKPTSKLRYHV